MSLHRLPIGVPCAICLTRITGWEDLGEQQSRTIPCGHTTVEIDALVTRVRRVRFGEYVGMGAA